MHYREGLHGGVAKCWHNHWLLALATKPCSEYSALLALLLNAAPSKAN